jgi:hypothetical protein
MSYTHEFRNDGFGGQYQGIITTFIYCKENNLKYVYLPLISVEHNYNNDPDYINKLEHLMNLKDNIQNENETLPQEILFKNIRNNFDGNIDEYCNSNTMKFIKECFWKNKERDHFKNNKMNVCIHIRRENLHDNGLAGDRANTPNEYYLRIMNVIREKYKEKQLQFHIYSQGEFEQFKDLEKEDVEFNLNEEITTTFVGLVAADILVISPSSFSYVAGLLSDGIVYYKNFWHNKKSEWILFS